MSGNKEILERYEGMAKSYLKESTNGKFDDCTKENWLIYRLKLTVNLRKSASQKQDSRKIYFLGKKVL